MNTENMAEGLSGREAHDEEAERQEQSTLTVKSILYGRCCMCMAVWQLSKYI